MRELAQRIFELFACAETRNRHGWDLDFFAGLRIAACASLALGLGEGAEANESDIFALLDALFDRVERGIENLFNARFRERRLFCDQVH